MALISSESMTLMVKGTLASEFLTRFWPTRLTYSTMTGSVTRWADFSISIEYCLPTRISQSVEYQLPMPRPPMLRVPMAFTSSSLPALMCGLRASPGLGRESVLGASGVPVMEAVSDEEPSSPGLGRVRRPLAVLLSEAFGSEVTVGVDAVPGSGVVDGVGWGTGAAWGRVVCWEPGVVWVVVGELAGFWVGVGVVVWAYAKGVTRIAARPRRVMWRMGAPDASRFPAWTQPYAILDALLRGRTQAQERLREGLCRITRCCRKCLRSRPAGSRSGRCRCQGRSRRWW